jgi:hypothetical protein
MSLTKELVIEQFKTDAGSIYFDTFSCAVDTRFNIVTFTDVVGEDVVMLDTKEARELRDWLNKVLP